MKCCSNKPSWSRLLSIVTLTPFLFLGCSGGRDGPERFELNGKVTVDGVPVLSGMLAISPDTKKGNSGPGTTIIIGQGASPQRFVSSFDGSQAGVTFTFLLCDTFCDRMLFV